MAPATTGSLGGLGWLERLSIYFALLATPKLLLGHYSGAARKGASWLSACRLLVWIEFGCILSWRVVQDAGCPETASLADLWSNLPAIPASRPMQGLLRSTCTSLRASPLGGLWIDVLEALIRMPLTLLLPRIVYFVSLSVLITTVSCLLLLQPIRRNGCGAVRACCAPARLVAAALVGPVVLVSGQVGCVIGCLGVLQLRWFLWIVDVDKAQSRNRGAATNLDRHNTSVEQSGQTRLAGGSGWHQNRADARDRRFSVWFVTGMWSLYTMQLFFYTGHFCEFSGLQYNAAFVGFKEFEFYTSGALLALNTFGVHVLMTLALPFLPPVARHFSEVGTRLRVEKNDETGPQSDPAKGSDFKLCVVVYGLLRTLNAVASVISVAIQRRHLLVWAVFAPKFVFEVCFLLVTDVGLVLCSGLMLLLT